MSFGFPLLRPKALVGYFKLLDCNDITKEQLKEPTAEFARKMYRICCLEIGSCTPEELDVTCPNVAGLEKLMGEHDMHGHSLPLLALFRATARMMEYCDSTSSGDKFTLDDITQPSAKRLIRHLSGFINFFKFLDERRNKYEGMDEQTVALEDEADMVADENEKLKERIAMLRAKQAEDMPKIEACREQVAVLESSIETKKNHTAEKKQTLKRLKKKREELTDAIDSQKLHTFNMEEECDELRGQIVTSPEKLQGEVREKKELVQAEKARIADIESTRRQIAAKQLLLTRADQDVVKVLGLLEGLSTERTKGKAAHAEANATRRRLAAMQGEMGEVSETKEEVEDAVVRLGERAAKEVEDAAMRKASCAAELDGIAAQLAAHASAQGEASDQARACRTETIAKRRAMAEARVRMEAEEEEHLETLETLLSAVERYDTQLLGVTGAAL